MPPLYAPAFWIQTPRQAKYYTYHNYNVRKNTTGLDKAAESYSEDAMIELYETEAAEDEEEDWDLLFNADRLTPTVQVQNLIKRNVSRFFSVKLRMIQGSLRRLVTLDALQCTENVVSLA